MPGAAPNAAAEATLMMPRGTPGSAVRRIGANTWQPWIGSPQVDAQHPLPVLEWEFADRGAAGADAGVVDDQRRRGAEPGLRLGGQSVDVVELGDVAGDCDGLATEFADRVDGSLGGDLVDVAADDPAAALGEFDRERRADSAARAGHHRTRVVAHLGRFAERPDHRQPAFPVTVVNAAVAQGMCR